MLNRYRHSNAPIRAGLLAGTADQGATSPTTFRLRDGCYFSICHWLKRDPILHAKVGGWAWRNRDPGNAYVTTRGTVLIAWGVRGT